MAEKVRKFMQVLKPRAWRELKKRAAARDIGPQMLLRAVVVPEWLKRYKLRQRKAAQRRRRR